MAQGLLCAFDSLYVVAFENKQAKRPAGLFRVRDTNDDDQYDSVELLRQFKGGSEHGPHAVILSPDKKSLYICAGNATSLPDPETSRVPLHWQEDQLLTRLPDASGHAAGRLAPGGWVCKTDPDGKSFELVSMGFRNEYDIAFDPNGELFTYDADMEWDVGLPWYRPTRVCHVVSGGEWGWRHGSGKWPDYYPDSVPPVINIGPGSPTGITFGTGAKFPAKYQNSLFISDWSYGLIYTVQMKPDGASYTATAEQFCAAPALPVTDLVINPVDGAMYFLIGGRRSQSGLYRITYTGSESTAPVSYPGPGEFVGLRRQLEAFHVPGAQADMDLIWNSLTHQDRFIRYAARVALEHQPFSSWSERVKSASDPQVILETVMALARCGEKSDQPAAVAALGRLDWDSLSDEQKLHLLRDYGLVMIRLGNSEALTAAVQKLSPQLPSGHEFIDRELAKLLIASDSAEATPKIVAQMIGPNSQEQQIAYAMMLVDANAGWTPELREQYFDWFLKAGTIYGGNSLGGYIQNIRNAAIASLSKEEQDSLAKVLARKPEITDPYAELKARPFVKKWTLDDLMPITDEELSGRDLENGKKLFAVATCYKCHRMQGNGGIVGPDLTPAGYRFNTRDLVETMIDPSKEVSDQYEATIFQLADGRTVTGRVANLSKNVYKIQEDMINPGKFTDIKVEDIDDMKPSKVSMMPTGLLDNLTRDEILDLVAYMKSTSPVAKPKTE